MKNKQKNEQKKWIKNFEQRLRKSLHFSSKRTQK